MDIMNRMSEDDRVKITKLMTKIDILQKEAGQLAQQSYSQSDPNAMMNRRDNRRLLARAEREYDELMKKYKNTSNK